MGLWGPPGGDGRTKLQAQRGEHDAGIPEGYRLLNSQERWEQTLEGTQTPHPRTLPPSEARSGSGAARRAPPRRRCSAGPAPGRAAPAAPPSVLWCLALPSRPAYGSRSRRAAASGAVTQCGQRRHSPRVALKFGIPEGPEARAAASGPGPRRDLARPPAAPVCPFGLGLTTCGPRPSLRPPVLCSRLAAPEGQAVPQSPEPRPFPRGRAARAPTRAPLPQASLAPQGRVGAVRRRPPSPAAAACGAAAEPSV